jgi:hypothetical protein
MFPLTSGVSCGIGAAESLGPRTVRQLRANRGADWRFRVGRYRGRLQLASASVSARRKSGRFDKQSALWLLTPRHQGGQRFTYRPPHLWAGGAVERGVRRSPTKRRPPRRRWRFAAGRRHGLAAPSPVHCGGVQEAGVHVGRFQIWVGGQNPLSGVASGQQAKHIGGRDPQTADTRLAGHNHRIHRYAFQQIHDANLPQ